MPIPFDGSLFSIHLGDFFPCNHRLMTILGRTILDGLDQPVAASDPDGLIRLMMGFS
jgi:hypothetical protein